VKDLLGKLQILKSLKYISLIRKTLQSDNRFILWLLMSGSYLTISCLQQVQLQWQDKTGFRLDLGNAVGVKRLRNFWPHLMRAAWRNTLLWDFLTS